MNLNAELSLEQQTRYFVYYSCIGSRFLIIFLIIGRSVRSYIIIFFLAVSYRQIKAARKLKDHNGTGRSLTLSDPNPLPKQNLHLPPLVHRKFGPGICEATITLPAYFSPLRITQCKGLDGRKLFAPAGRGSSPAETPRALRGVPSTEGTFSAPQHFLETIARTL